MGGVFALVLGLALVPGLAVELAAVGFFLVYLAVVAIRMPRLDATYLRRHATDTDEPAPIIFLVTLAAIMISLASLFLLLNRENEPTISDLLLGFAAVALGWLTIHTMAALHYAHLYWRPSRAVKERGLEFPHSDAPGGFDFLYFALVIGMTCQTSDVAITATSMRKANLVHAVVSFFFNTVLVAAAVNAAVSLAG
ncbi:DUF1345 domain-containing protein [Pelagibacterium montanilacus]|uniref:DUF1345 domain-containing protein n=1 Tax=Pelagibacterium montanilacus TaxID=2185280 RepID=UPI000F8C5CF4|nr:DUF1345 domain-containing protein [Pelagibacterium montanilacus]